MSDPDRRIVTVFRSVLRHDAEANGYAGVSDEMAARARAMPGYVDHKGFTAPDGERVTIVVFDSYEHQRAWSEDPAHRVAQRRGRDQFYETYSISVCEEIRTRTWRATAD